MTIASMSLTEEQRQQLLDVLYRRFKKTTDHTLLELERLTRHPVNLTGFQATGLAVAKTEMTNSEAKPADEVIDAAFSTPLSRREFMAFSASGLLTLLLGGAGTGWYKSNESVNDLSATMAGVEVDVNTLEEIMRELQTTISSCNLVMAELSSSYQQTTNSIALLKDSIDKTHSIYSQLDETQINIVEVIRFLSELAASIPGYAEFSQPITAVLDILRNTPDTIFLAENAMTNLDLWFSDEQGQGINQRLLSPAQIVFETVATTVAAQVESIQDRLAGL